MTKLSVNINKIATLRNARGGNNPDVVKVALDCERFGAQGITVHPRPDERHIRKTDVYALRPLLTTEFNIEGYPSPEFVDLVLKVKPHQVTLVPDAPDQITSNAGWDTKKNLSLLTDLIEQFTHPVAILIREFTTIKPIITVNFLQLHYTTRILTNVIYSLIISSMNNK